MTAPTPNLSPKGRGRAMTTDAREFFRTLTLGNPKWVALMEREVRAGDPQTIRLLMGYLPALPPGLRAAVLAARARS
jgi:hypothetical protein